MANAVAATIADVQLLGEDLTGGNRYCALMSVKVPAADSGAPTGLTISGVTTAIQNARRDGKTATLLTAFTKEPAVNASGTKAYLTATGNAYPLTVSTSTLTGSVCTVTAVTLSAWATDAVQNAMIIVDYSLA